MVLIVQHSSSCYSSCNKQSTTTTTTRSSSASSSCREVPSMMTSFSSEVAVEESRTFHDSTRPTRSLPVTLRTSSYPPCDESPSPFGRLHSPLSTSAESIKSNCSTRSSAERDAEREQRRQLLDASLVKIRGNSNLPLRKHLLVFNTIKQLQHELDALDEEELYSSLMGHDDYAQKDERRMDVDECRWLMAPPASAPPTLEERRQAPAPHAPLQRNQSQNQRDQSPTIQRNQQKQQEQQQHVVPTSYPETDFEMDVDDAVEEKTPTWSWCSMADEQPKQHQAQENNKKIGGGVTTGVTASLFGSQVAQDDSYSWRFGNNNNSNNFANGSSWWLPPTSSFLARSVSEPSIWSSDVFGASPSELGGFGSGLDELGSATLSRFELQHLFPSQLLLQA